MPARLEFDFMLGRGGRPRDDEEPMRLLVLGDFSGTPVAERPPLASRPSHRVDIDDLDAIVRRLAPRLQLAAGEISFEGIEDFHPDRLYRRLQVFDALREARTRPPADADQLLGRLLGERGETRARPAVAASGIEALIREIVAPHIVKDTSTQPQVHLTAVDAAIAGQMRELLHDPAFQSLEAVWRGAHWLVSGLELDEHLQLHLFDVTREELLGDISAAEGRLAETALHRALVDRWRNVPGGHRWSALAAQLQFGPSDTDIRLLAALGAIASQAGGPLLAGADPAIARGGQPPHAGWQALRRSRAAPWIALGAPRVLLRLPYGRTFDPIDSFTFEELVGPPVHDHFLWGNSSLAMALLIGRGFAARGWNMEPGDEREIGDMPAYTFIRNGEHELQPCAERFVTEREIQTLLDAGIVPVASRRDRNAVVVMRFQSIADPPAPLAW